MPPAFPFDALLFDLDGTLLATDRFWLPAARVGARRAFDELGLEREIPSASDWMALIGLPLDEGFRGLFPDLDDDARDLVQARCIEEEHFALEAGKAALLPGVRDALMELRELGVPMGIASNCSQEYLDAAMNDMNLREFVAEGRCLDSPGVRDKAGMIEDLLLTFGTRSAVMVGDRAGDCAAAHTNGLPHVHLETGFAPAGESIVCEARIHDFGELLPRLRVRESWIDAALDSLGFGGPNKGPCSLGISGRSGSGKSLFARDAAVRLAAHGRQAVVVALDDYLRPEASALVADGQGAELAPHEHLGRAFDVDALIEGVLEPHARGEVVTLRQPSIETGPASSAGQSGPVIGADDVLVLDGLFLLHPRLRPRLERVLYLAAPTRTCLARVAGRELPLGRGVEFERVRRLYLPAQESFEATYPPDQRADLVLDGANPLGRESGGGLQARVPGG